MRKTVKLSMIMLAVMCLWWGIRVVHDKQTLRRDIIRLHVVAASDSAEDQNVKLTVRDAVLDALRDLESQPAAAEAKVYLQSKLVELEGAANLALAAAGSLDRAKVTLCTEEFPIREYDTFTLPSGIYESLRVTIGSGEGKNWWCVVFPKLCVGAASEDFQDTAAGAGFSESLSKTLSGDENYQFSFYFLDLLGKLENFFHFR